MRDADFIDFLQWALPRMGYRWPGFRKVRGQVRKRVARRLGQLDLPDLAAYRDRLAADPEEWRRLDSLCRITISRFFRDRALFESLGAEILPVLVRGALAGREPVIRAWSAGCGAGEEPYSLAILLREAPSLSSLELAPEIVGTDSDRHQLGRARRGCYPPGSLKDLPPEWRDRAFQATQDIELCLRSRYRADVRFLLQDVRCEAPRGLFSLVLCRNLAFTYFDDPTQRRVLRRLRRHLRPRGALVLGSHEQLPAGIRGFEPWPDRACVFRRV